MRILVHAQRFNVRQNITVKKKSPQHNLLRHNILFTIHAGTSKPAVSCILLVIMSRHVQEEDDPRVLRPRPRDKFCLR